MMRDYLFIRVEKVKKELKFRFMPDQEWKDASGNTIILDSTKNIRIQGGRNMKSFREGSVYYMQQKPYIVSIRSSGSSTSYSVNRWGCNYLLDTLSSMTDSPTETQKQIAKTWDEYKEYLASKEVDAMKTEREEHLKSSPDSYFSKLHEEFISSKPEISTDGFYMSDSDWMILIRNIKQNVNTLVTGPTGSGKTTAIKLACEKLGIPCSVYDMGSMFDPISSLLGVHRLVDGNSKFDYAKFAQDIQKPGVILLDELSRAPIQSNNILFPCLDDRRTLPVEIAGCKDVRAIRIHPEVCFIATANIGAEYTGTNIMDRALQNRFFPLELNYLDNKHESEVLIKRCGIEKDDAKLIVKVASDIRGIYKKQELSVSVGTRETLMIADLVKDGWSIKEALSLVLLPLFEGTTDPTEEATERGKIRKLLMTF